ncbi:MAG: PH domain-containing protein, partial [Corynebacteriales bacterium]|nr:PH domain-containing protein [Mycobacteriales bacterium]
MAFPQELLDSDERVIVHLHPHWKTLFFPAIWLLLITILMGSLIAMINISAIQLIVLLVGIGLLCYLVVRPLVYWMTTHFVLTTHRVLTRTGFLHRAGRDIPLARVNDVSFSQTLFERLLGCGTLVVESAGERGQVVLHNIPGAEAVQSRLYRLMEDDAERRAALHHTPPTVSGY